MINLPQVTCLSISTRDHQAAAEALRYSTRGIKFGAVKLVSDYEPEDLYGFIEFEKIDSFPSIAEWNKYLVYEAYKHVDTEYAFICHPDGFAVNPSCWRNDFLNYDYVGALWVEIEGLYLTPEGERIRVGNSVSIRSRKLMELPSKINMPWVPNPDGIYSEDVMICIHQRKYFIDNGCVFAPVEVAKHFSYEASVPENAGLKTFAFHKHHYDGHPNNVYPKFV